MNSIMMFLPLIFIITIIVAAVAVLKFLKTKDNKIINSGEKASIPLVLVGFFAPLIGIILYFVWRNDRPALAWSVGYGVKVYFILILIWAALLVTAGLIEGVSAL